MDQQTAISAEHVAKQWLTRAIVARDSHYKQGKIFRQQHTTLGIAICIISAVVGSSIFASIAHSTDNMSKIVVGLLSIMASILAALHTFLNLPEKSEKHRATAIRFSSLVRRLEIIVSSRAGEEVILRSLVEVEKEWNNVNYDAPLAPMQVWLPTVEEVTRRQFPDKQ